MATFAIVNIQRDVAGHNYLLVVVPRNGAKFDTSAGIQSQSFNYGNAIETWAGLTLTADSFTINMIQSGSIDHNFKVKLATDGATIGIDSTGGDGMKLVQFNTDQETPMDQTPIHSRKHQ